MPDWSHQPVQITSVPLSKQKFLREKHNSDVVLCNTCRHSTASFSQNNPFLYVQSSEIVTKCFSFDYLCSVEAPWTARGAAMDSSSSFQIKYFPEREFDQKVDCRAERREHLRGRNNVTSCRSPTRDVDTRRIKNELKEKRQLEFLRRRSVSPEPSRSKCRNCSRRRNPALERFSDKNLGKSESLYTNIQYCPSADGHQEMILTTESRINESPGTSKWVNDALLLFRSLLLCQVNYSIHSLLFL